jgi:hypothetical protein
MESFGATKGDASGTGLQLGEVLVQIMPILEEAVLIPPIKHVPVLRLSRLISADVKGRIRGCASTHTNIGLV